MPEQQVDWSKITQPCPKCGHPMVVRTNHDNGSRFLGCVGWPAYCQETAPITAYAILKAQGAQSLPGFE